MSEQDILNRRTQAMYEQALQYVICHRLHVHRIIIPCFDDRRHRVSLCMT